MLHASRNIIISADDFGKSKTANQNILELAKLGKVQRVSILINGKFSKKEVNELLDSKVKLDAHLILPGTDHNNDQRKVLRRSFLFLARLIAGRTTLSKVEKVWEKQIQKFKKIFGRYPDGINSHEHVHFFPPYFKIALRLGEKYKIPHLRAATNNVVNNGNKVGRILKVLNSIKKKKSNSYNYITSLDWIENIDKFLNNSPQGSLEIICHPEREKEYKIIKKLN